MNDHLPLLPAQRFAAGQRESTRAELVELARGWRTSKRRRMVIVSSIAAVALIGGGTATAIQVFGTKRVTNHAEARCYSRISSDFGDDFPGTTVAAPAEAQPSGTAGEAGKSIPVAPLEACAAAWQVGLLSGHAADRSTRAYPVPHLVGCVLPDGTAAVFPGPDGLCQQLGLATAAPQ